MANSANTVSARSKTLQIKKQVAHNQKVVLNATQQPSPTFLAPGTGFMEDNVSMHGGGKGMVQAVMQAMESGR